MFTMRFVLDLTFNEYPGEESEVASEVSNALKSWIHSGPGLVPDDSEAHTVGLAIYSLNNEVDVDVTKGA